MDGLSTVGIRELRNQVAAVVRRATNGERILITSDGRPVAMLGPVEPVGAATLEDLVAAGLVRPPGHLTRPTDPEPARLPVDVRTDRVVEEIRGG